MQAVLFDLDNTLYPAECDLFSLIDVRINRYMEEIVSIPADAVDLLRRDYWKNYGTTLMGLMLHHQVNPEDYLDYVHDIDVSSRVSRDGHLRESLESLPVPCYVFTNGSRCHADRVVAALGLEGLFADVFDIRVADYQPKPNLGPYRQVLKHIGLGGSECIMVEDQPQNLTPAKQLGMRTILVGQKNPADSSHIDAQGLLFCRGGQGLS